MKSLFFLKVLNRVKSNSYHMVRNIKDVMIDGFEMWNYVRDV